MTATVPTAAPPRVSWVGRLVLGALVVALFVVGGTAFRVWQVARQDDRQTADAVVVLGAAQYDGQPSSIFAARLKHAAAPPSPSAPRSSCSTCGCRCRPC